METVADLFFWAPKSLQMVTAAVKLKDVDIRDVGSIPGSARSPGGGHVNPLQYSSGESHGQGSLAGYSP